MKPADQLTLVHGLQTTAKPLPHPLPQRVIPNRASGGHQGAVHLDPTPPFPIANGVLPLDHLSHRPKGPGVELVDGVGQNLPDHMPVTRPVGNVDLGAVPIADELGDLGRPPGIAPHDGGLVAADRCQSHGVGDLTLLRRARW
ncbi:hypothetical protein FQZ97_891450 [compost metagenome]